MELFFIWIASVLISLGLDVIAVNKIIKTIKQNGKVIDWKIIKENYFESIKDDPNSPKLNPFIKLLFSSLFPITNIYKSISLSNNCTTLGDEICDMLDEVGIFVKKTNKSDVETIIKEEDIPSLISSTSDIIINTSVPDVAVISDKTSCISVESNNITYRNNTNKYIECILKNGKLYINEKHVDKNGLTKLNLSISKNNPHKNITIRTISGNVFIKELTNDKINVKTLSGNITISRTNSPINITSLYGSIDGFIDEFRSYYYMEYMPLFGLSWTKESQFPSSRYSKYILVKTLKNRYDLLFKEDIE